MSGIENEDEARQGKATVEKLQEDGGELADRPTNEDADLSEEFSLPQPAPQAPLTTPSQTITLHWLLTSDEVLTLKRKASEEKDAKEQEKKRRKEETEKKKLAEQKQRNSLNFVFNF
ncbi:hypothetical protein ElyMa_004690400 [Elysia marginata]|uniref:Uncharacterized protein n=1 Tax=Elysia marginata TaxID=1093978 RepID=A0AAV4I608_9GAST|nr:hypothetical protein ElyMa_004690400 [Elysia marginata]